MIIINQRNTFNIFFRLYFFYKGMHFSMLIKEIVHIPPFSWLTKVFILLLK